MHRPLPALVTAVAALAVAGCGGTTKTVTEHAPATTSASTPAQTDTKAAFIAKADAVCTRANARIGDLNGKIDAAPTPARRGAVIAEGARQIRAGIAELGRLERPAADTAIIERYVTLSGTVADLLDQAGDAFARGDASKGVAFARSAGTTSQQARGIAQGYGFKVCGGG